MTFKEYQKKAITTLTYIKSNLKYNKDCNTEELEIARLTLGLAGEAGEVAEKVKKFLRDTDMSTIAQRILRYKLKKELGDVLWYLASLAYTLNIDLDSIARQNINKLASRKKRGKIRGSGDKR